MLHAVNAEEMHRNVTHEKELARFQGRAARGLRVQDSQIGSMNGAMDFMDQMNSYRAQVIARQ